MENKDNIKNTITSKFKDKLWDQKELEGKGKLKCYEVINPTLANHNYLSVLTNAKKEMNIAKIRTNSHELRSEMRCWFIPKTSLDERINKL